MEGLSLGVGHDEESNLEVSSPRDVNSPLVCIAEPKLHQNHFKRILIINYYYVYIYEIR